MYPGQGRMLLSQAKCQADSFILSHHTRHNTPRQKKHASKHQLQGNHVQPTRCMQMAVAPTNPQPSCNTTQSIMQYTWQGQAGLKPTHHPSASMIHSTTYLYTAAASNTTKQLTRGVAMLLLAANMPADTPIYAHVQGQMALRATLWHRNIVKSACSPCLKVAGLQNVP